MPPVELGARRPPPTCATPHLAPACPRLTCPALLHHHHLVLLLTFLCCPLSSSSPYALSPPIRTCARAHDQVVEANAYLLKKRAEDQALQDAEEAKMLEYAAQKEKDLLERRDREEARFRERQAWRQQLIDRQIAKLTDMNAADNARLENQAAEVQAKAMEARAKARRAAQERPADHAHVAPAADAVEEGAQGAGDARGRPLRVGLKKLNVHAARGGGEAIRDRFEKAKGRDAFLLKQMAEKAAAKEEEKLEEMFEAEATKQWGQDDDAIFDQYAQMCLDEYVAAGKDPKPIELVMKKIKHRAD